jgi:hypothetical protein
MALEAYQQRVVEEHMALQEKVGKLRGYIETNPHFETLSHVERTDLREQLYFMQEYAARLNRRISRFTNLETPE